MVLAKTIFLSNLRFWVSKPHRRSNHWGRQSQWYVKAERVVVAQSSPPAFIRDGSTLLLKKWHSGSPLDAGNTRNLNVGPDSGLGGADQLYTRERKIKIGLWLVLGCSCSLAWGSRQNPRRLSNKTDGPFSPSTWNRLVRNGKWGFLWNAAFEDFSPGCDFSCSGVRSPDTQTSQGFSKNRKAVKQWDRTNSLQSRSVFSSDK